MKRLLISSSFFLLAFCAGCGLRPYVPELKHAPLTALTEAQNEALKSNAATQSDWPQEQWWRIFGDEQLNGLIEQSLDAHPSMKIAEAKVQIAAAQFRRERAPLFPNFNSSGDYTRIHNSKNGIFGLAPRVFPLTYNQPEISLNFSYEFDFWKKHTNLIVAAIDEVQARAAEAYLSKLILAVSVADAYFHLQASAARLEIAKELIRNRKDNIELTSLRRKNGLDNDWVVNRARTASLVASQFYEQVSEDVITSNNELQALLVSDFTVPIAAVDLSLGLNEPFPIPTTLPLELLAHRADVWAYRWRVEAAARQICVARANFYPNINIVGFVGLQSIFPSKLFQGDSTYGSIGPAFHLPLFDGGILCAEYDVSVQQYVIAVAQYDQAVLDAVKEVLNALAILKSTHELYLIAKASEEVAKDSLEVARQRLKHELNSKLDVLSYENDWLQSKDIYLQALLSCSEARLNLIRALGGGAGDTVDCCE